MPEIDLPNTTKRGRPKRSFMGAVKGDLLVLGETEEDTENRKRCRRLIHCGDP